MKPTLEQDIDKSRRLIFATGVTVVVLVAEALGGWFTHSLALMSDAGHLFADVLSLALSLFALRLACRLPTDTRTYGYHRAEIFAAMVNGLMLFVIAGLIWREAYSRFFSPPHVKTLDMLIIAVVGLVANWLVLTRLSGHSHGDINLHSAYLHVLGDLLASVGVVVGAIVMAGTHWYLADPIISVAIGGLILLSAWRVMAEAAHILLQGVPRNLDVNEIAAAMAEDEDVLSIHALRVWAVCSNAYILSAHVVTCLREEKDRVALRARLRELLSDRFSVAEATLELECEPLPGEQLIQPLPHHVAHDEHHEHNH